ncbi:MAG TPA: hypothetical protein VNM87_10255, partial [Candidatus Udaeobacter sp.]|nr:hypothetical protein [Candidatus Udaeobacter sp.]
MNRMLTLAVLGLLVSAAGASAVDRTTRTVGPLRSWQASDLARFSDQVVHVKFVEGSAVDWNGDRFAGSGDLSLVQAAIAKQAVIEVRSTFDVDRATARGWKAAGEARSGKTGPDLSLWYSIRVSGGAAAVAKLVNDLNASPAVEIAHPEAKPELAVITSAKPDAPSASAVIPDFTGNQGYLYGPPVGLDAPSAWGFPGGKGQGGKFIDVELAWTQDHQDFPFARMFHL